MVAVLKIFQTARQPTRGKMVAGGEGLMGYVSLERLTYLGLFGGGGF